MLRHRDSYRHFTYLSPIALIVAAVACGSDGDSGGGGSTPGAGGTATGGAASGGSDTGGAGTGATGAGGAGTGATAAGGTGTGGAATGGAGTGATGAGGTGTGGAATGGASGGGVVPGTAGYDCTPASGTVPALQATPILTSGVDQPIVVAHEPNGAAGRIFVLSRLGRIHIVENGSLRAAPFLDFSSKVVAGQGGADERGALGLAFHPDYATNGLLYVHYNDADDPNDTGDSIIEEYEVSSDPNVATPTSGRVVLRVEQPANSSSVFRNHKGGAINFGADGFLYIGLGDGGDSGDPSGNGQDVTALLGKILRINPVASGSDAYTVPAGNLKDTMSNAAPEVWDYGLRNPFRSTFDGCTGDFYIGDVGQSAWEEVNVEKAGEGGKNYGWNSMEGNHCYEPPSGCNETGITLPVLEYDRTSAGGKSVIGGAVYRGSSLPGLRGSYIYGDYDTGNIWRTVYDRTAGTVSTPVSLKMDLNNVSALVAINNGPDGEIYFTSIAGSIYKLEPAE
jgi:glucose/arabinose dehydrogenase